jgi:hypothetical protein
MQIQEALNQINAYEPEYFKAKAESAIQRIDALSLLMRAKVDYIYVNEIKNLNKWFYEEQEKIKKATNINEKLRNRIFDLRWDYSKRKYENLIMLQARNGLQGYKPIYSIEGGSWMDKDKQEKKDKKKKTKEIKDTPDIPVEVLETPEPFMPDISESVSEEEE